MIVWRDVPGWEGLYAVSNDGQVKSIYRVDAEHPHPVEHGREHHFGYDFDRNEMHEWNGATGKCRVYTPDDGEAE